jgi:anti-sigma regulatory factor (Ser/Thr protein kinase)
MLDFTTDVLSLDLACDRTAPATVRAALARSGRLGALLDDGLLVASELVTNAVLHSGCGPDHLLEVRVHQLEDHLLISIHDPGLSDHGVQIERGNRAQPGGWGLRIIERLARRWGAERPDGYRVWAELALPA